MTGTEREECKDRERKAQRLLQKKRSWDEEGEVQDLAVLKRIKRAANEKRAARLKQQEIFIPQWPDQAIIDFFHSLGMYPSRASLALKMFYP